MQLRNLREKPDPPLACWGSYTGLHGGCIVVNLKWHDAVAVAAAEFKTKAERDAGWPQTMTVGQLAVLQRPYLSKTEPGYKASLSKTRAMATAIVDACEQGAIQWSTVTRQTPYQIMRIVPGDARFAMRNVYGEREVKPRQQLAWSTKDVQVKAIAAPAFTAWLATQGETPSAHIAAWFEAVGANTQTQLKAAPVQADEPTEDRNDRWLAFYETEEKAGRKRGAYERGSKQFGVDRSTYNKAVKATIEKRAEKYRADIKAVPAKGKVTGWGSQLVKNGKRTKGAKA